MAAGRNLLTKRFILQQMSFTVLVDCWEVNAYHFTRYVNCLDI